MDSRQQLGQNLKFVDSATHCSYVAGLKNMMKKEADHESEKTNMGWKMKWRQSRKLGPLRVTQTLRGTSLSLGIPGIRYTIRADGKRQISLGIPGTGLSWTNVIEKKA